MDQSEKIGVMGIGLDGGWYRGHADGLKSERSQYGSHVPQGSNHSLDIWGDAACPCFWPPPVQGIIVLSGLAEPSARVCGIGTPSGTNKDLWIQGLTQSKLCHEESG